MRRASFLLPLFLLCYVPCVFAQAAAEQFVLDKSKPFAYLVFDHIGKVESYNAVDLPQRLYLRIVNNCRIPIVVKAQGAEGHPEAILEDEVLSIKPILRIVGENEDVKQEERVRAEALKHKPDGYEFEVSGVATIQPGKSLLFSVSRNHVSEFWFMRIKFALAVDRSSASSGPFTYLDFYEDDIPKK